MQKKITRLGKIIFKKGGAARGLFALSTGAILAQAITFLATPFLARLYTPAEFGLLAVFISVSSIATVLANGRYDASILVPNTENEAATLVLLSLLLATFSSILLFFLSIITPIAYLNIIGVDALKQWLPFAFIAGGFSAIAISTQGWLNRKKLYSQISKLRIIQSASLVITPIILGLTLEEEFGLILGHILGYSLSGLVAYTILRSTAPNWNHHNLYQVAKLYKNSPKYILPNSLIDTISLQIPIFALTSAYGTNDAGNYSIATRFLALPAALIGGAIGQIFAQKASSLIYTNPTDLFALYKKTTILLLLIITPIFIIIITSGESIFALVLGNEWQEAGRIAELLIFSAAIYFIFSPTSIIFILLKKEKILLLFSLFQLFYRIVAFLLTDSSANYIYLLVIFECINVTLIEFFLIRIIKQEKTND